MIMITMISHDEGISTNSNYDVFRYIITDHTYASTSIPAGIEFKTISV